jgi:ribokinase
MDLVVVGSSNTDLVINVTRIPEIGETVLGGKSTIVFGGKGANQAVAAKRAGSTIAFITKVGKDLFGDNMVSHFKNEGFALETILIDPIHPTGIAQILVSEKGENSIAVAPGANMNLTKEDIRVLQQIIEKAKIVLVQLEIPIETVAFITEIAFKSGTKVILNPAPAQKLSKEILQKTWLITPNETEVELLTGIKVFDLKSAENAGQILLKSGVENVIITLGARGSLLCTSKNSKHFRAFHEKAIDTTAAGDAFNGVLAAQLAQDKDLHKAIHFATAAAAISVTRNGAQTSIPTLKEIEDYLIHKKE